MYKIRIIFSLNSDSTVFFEVELHVLMIKRAPLEPSLSLIILLDYSAIILMPLKSAFPLFRNS